MRKLYLHILQLEGYEALRFTRWLLQNPFTVKVEGKKPLVWTSKAETIYKLSLLTTVLLPALLFLLQPVYALVSLIVLGFFPWISLLLALSLLKPYEIFNRQKVISDTRRKILGFHKLQVIGITGSYGKTSVKDILYNLLRKKYRVLKTPASYNTVFGISKVVDLELNKNHDFFICEMGAYKIGEVEELCKMVLPKHGILTGIAEQHLERFGSLQNIIQGKFELIESLPNNGHAILNGDNSYILENAWRAKSVYKLYGINNKKTLINVEGIKYSKNGTSFVLKIGKKSFVAKTKLLGKGNIQNILGAATLALELGLTIVELKDAIEKLEPTSNRLELLENGGNTILNNSYSSNPVGFKESITLVKEIKSRKKIIITPGIVELGPKTKDIHEELGSFLEGVFDVALLVGENDRTKALAKNLKKTKVEFVKSTNEALAKIKKENEALVLIENDLPDNY